MSLEPHEQTMPPLAPTAPVPAEELPPLQNGDRLTRAEFERRYEAMPHVKKAELIEGVVYMPSPVRYVQHGGPHFDLIAWLGCYRALTPGVGGGDNTTLRLDSENEPQPDAFLMILPEAGGQARIDEDGHIAGAPELVAEVAASSVSYDLHDKLEAYCKNGVKEYVVWRVRDRALDWFVLGGTAPHSLTPNAAGVIASRIFPGLCLDTAALLSGNLSAVFQAVQQGVASDEHRQFAAALARKLHS